MKLLINLLNRLLTLLRIQTRYVYITCTCKQLIECCLGVHKLKFPNTKRFIGGHIILGCKRYGKVDL